MNTTTRIGWIDIGKTLTIALVYYIHVIQGPALKNFPYGTLEFRLLSPIIAFFFFISGIVYKSEISEFKRYALKSIERLVTPLFFFNIVSLLLLIIVRLFYQGPLVVEAPGSVITRLLALFIIGFPAFNGPTWFLTCLFSIDIIYFFVAPFTKGNGRLIISMILFSIVGYEIAPFLNQQVFILKTIKYFWYVPMALTAIVFFQAGILIRNSSVLRVLENNRLGLWTMLFLAGVLSVISTNLNKSAYTGYFIGQHIHHLNYGNYFLFYISYFSTIVSLMCMSILIKPYKLFLFYGKNILIVFGLCGIFYHFVNPSIAQWIMNNCKNISQVSFLSLTLMITILQLAICYPLIGIGKKCLGAFRNIFFRNDIFSENSLQKKI